MLNGISHYHPQWPVGSGGCSAIEYIGLVPPRKHVLWGSGLRDWEEGMLSQLAVPQGFMLSLSVNQRVLCKPEGAIPPIPRAGADSTGYSWPLGIWGKEISVYPCCGRTHSLSTGPGWIGGQSAHSLQ